MVGITFFDAVFTDDDLFYFVELMDSVEPVRVFARRSSLASETTRQSCVFQRQLFTV